MDEEKKSIYDDLQRRLGNYPVNDFVRAYALAYFEADVETIKNCGSYSASPRNILSRKITVSQTQLWARQIGLVHI